MKAGVAVKRACLIAAVALLLLPGGVRALEFSPEGNSVELLDASGNPETRAGAHPDRFLHRLSLVSGEGADDPKELVFDLPPGLGGSSNAVPYCPREAFGEAFANGFGPPCPEESRVGTFVGPEQSFPIYSLEPGPNELVVFGGVSFIVAMKFVATMRPEDGGTSLRLIDLQQKLFPGGTLELWGVPADHQEGTSIPRRALLTNPTECSAQPPIVKVRGNSWQHPDLWTTNVLDTGHPLVDCASLPFSPTAAFSLDERRADAPTGTTITITVPQEEDPDRRATSMLRGLSITMPKGLTVSAGGSAGLSACGDGAFGIGNGREPECPPSSRVGSVQLQAVGGGGPLSGPIYLGEEHPGDRFRVLVGASGRGIELKFAASLRVDPVTGQMTVDLAELPRPGFERMTLAFRGGPRSLLATPIDCGAAPAAAHFTPYSGGAPVDWRGSIDIVSADGGRCQPARFAPRLEGGSASRWAGRATSFTTTIRRADGEQLPAAMTIELPVGVGAAIGAVAKCGAGAADGACPPESRIGQAIVELGPGGHPARIEGDVYLTGRYRGSPYGIALAFDAGIGAFDFGALVMRGGLEFDLETGRATVEVKSLPTGFGGLPVRLQTIGLNLDRPGFTFNPTSCSTGSVDARLRSQSGAVAELSSPFRVQGCLGLRFRPRLSVALGSAAEIHRGGHPSLRMSLRTRPRSANLRSAEVRLPSVLGMDTNGLKQLCSSRRASEGRCPKASRIGVASARTPLLKGRMEGSLFVVQPRGDDLPDIWTSIAGQGFQLNLRAKMEVEDGTAVAKFVGLPDFPMRALVLRFFGGEDGVLKLQRRPCGRLSAPARMVAQDGRSTTVAAPVAVPSGCGDDG